MYLKFSLIADSAVLAQGGKLTAVGIFDVIYSTKFPTIHRDMTLIAVVEGAASEKGEHKLTIELRDEDQNRVFALDQKFELKPIGPNKNILTARFISRLQDVPFKNPGPYEFVLFADERFLGRCRLAAIRVNVEEAGKQ